MARVTKWLLVLALASGAVLGLATPFFQNTWLLLTDGGTGGYFVPRESSLLTFHATRLNGGARGWWVTGEDGTNYYAADEGPGYILFPKSATVDCKTFDAGNSTTWCAWSTRRVVP